MAPPTDPHPNKIGAPSHALLVGLPRSGTTWLARALGAHPAIHLVHEPDNRRVDLLGWLGTGRVGVVPSLVAGDRAPDYRAMWRLAFAGSWPDRGALGWSTTWLRRRAAGQRLGRRLTLGTLRTAAWLGAHRDRPAPVVLVKSVAAQLAVDWLAAEFAPRMLVVWRHPVNVVPSWLSLGWAATGSVSHRPAVRARFAGTPVWPAPRDGVQGAAWSACAQLTILLEAAARDPHALVLHHESNALDPSQGARAALTHLGLVWDESVAEFIDASDRTGEGWATDRVTAEEPARWRTRLGPRDAAAVLETVEAFQRESTVASSLWPMSPAISS